MKTAQLLHRSRFVLFATLAWLGVSGLRAQDIDLTHLPSYQPDPSVSGTVRIWGNSIQAEVVKNWQESFAQLNPRIHLAYTPQATSTAIAALYMNTGDLALLGQEIWHIETQAFVRTFKHIPLGLRVTSGSFGTRGSTEALGIFVHKDNPLAQFTFQQIDAIFGAEHLRGTRNFRKWGDLGLTGEWADKPIHIYGYWLDGGEAEFLRQVVLKNSYLWNSEYQQFWNRDVAPDGTIIENAGQHWNTDPVIDGKILVETGVRITAALARDPYGIALNGVAYVDPNIKGAAIAENEGDPFVAPTKENVANRTYPLTRSSYIYLNRDPGQPVDPKVREFLRFVLSREGQAAVAREGKSLPLTVEVAREN